MNYPGSGTIDLWFITSAGANTGAVLDIGAGVPVHVLDMFCFGCPTNGISLNSLSSSSSLPISLVSDFVSCSYCSIEKQRCEGKELDHLFDLNYMVFILLPKCLEC